MSTYAYVHYTQLRTQGGKHTTEFVGIIQFDGELIATLKLQSKIYAATTSDYL
jgi:hypothetical protein